MDDKPKQRIYSPDYMRVKSWRGGNRARYNEYMRAYRARKRGDIAGSDGVSAPEAASRDPFIAEAQQIWRSGVSPEVWEDGTGGQSSD